MTNNLNDRVTIAQLCLGRELIMFVVTMKLNTPMYSSNQIPHLIRYY